MARKAEKLSVDVDCIGSCAFRFLACCEVIGGQDTDGEEEQPESQTVIELRGDRTQLGVQQVVQPYDECPNAEGDGPWRKQTAPVATYDLFL